MILVSHRGNLFGPDDLLENNPTKIAELISRGFHVEVDVWSQDGKLYLGHDEPSIFVSTDFVLHPQLWCHAKNLDALEHLTNVGAQCFWHQTDDYTLTSKNFIWTYPGKHITSRSIMVCRTIEETEKALQQDVYGVCSDYVGHYKNHLGGQ